MLVVLLFERMQIHELQYAGLFKTWVSRGCEAQQKRKVSVRGEDELGRRMLLSDDQGAYSTRTDGQRAVSNLRKLLSGSLDHYPSFPGIIKVNYHL